MALEALDAPKARERQREGQARGRAVRHGSGSASADAEPEPPGKTSTIVARELGVTIDLVQRVVADDPVALDLFDQALQGRHGGDRSKSDNVTLASDPNERGNSETGALRRLRREAEAGNAQAAELRTEVLAGRLTAHAAMVRAGFRPHSCRDVAGRQFARLRCPHRAPGGIMRRLHLVLLTIALAVPAAGCASSSGSTGASSGDTQAASPTASAPAGSQRDKAAVDFVSGLTTTTLKAQQDLVPLTSPNSAARAYIDYLVAYTDAQTSAGHTLPAGRFTSQGEPETLTECDNVAEDPHPCAAFSNFQYDGRGLISGFDLDGQPVRAVVAVGGPEQTASGVTVRPLGASRDTGNGTVGVAYKVTNGTARVVTMAYNSAEMVSGGTQHDTVAGAGPDSLPPSVSGTFLAQFNAQDPTGTLQVEADYEDNGGGPLAKLSVTLVPVA
ncbi:hypothetical protein [Frankia tisae]|uniref:hypothetical protein n=1 Tax=Frankia tisae TaxID=2950104 RepID=UPI0021C2448E|nr:hypothetical protein [Frankia tisae]